MALKFVRFSVIGAIAAISIVSACEQPLSIGAGVSALAGLAPGATNDNNPVTTLPATGTPGSFTGTVVGHIVLYNLRDTISLLPHIAGARLTAYMHTSPTATDTIGIGLAVASVVTDVDGHFQFPTIPGALYIVTVTPPPHSPYQGVWVAAIAHSRSGDFPWSVELPVK